MKIFRTLAVLAAVATAGTAGAQPLLRYPSSEDTSDFAWTLYRKAAALKPGRNTLVSPYSAREAVGLAYVGARGATAEGLAKALGAGGRVDFLASAKETRSSIEAADPRTTIEVANSLWLRSDWSVLDSYVARAQDGFGAEVFRRDFTPETVAEADAWVSSKTHGKIKKAIDELDPADKAVLLNAVYFKGIWEHPFDKASTKVQDFTLASGKVVRSPRMTSSAASRRDPEAGSFGYAENHGLQAVRLPYGSGRISMIVVLPAKGTALTNLGSKADGAWWRSLRAELLPRAGRVELPRFKFEASEALNRPLIAMGAADAFDPERADFRDMAGARASAEKLAIGQVQQTAMIEVDEEGTVAAAKTSVSMYAGRGAMAEPEPPFVFIADRPFLFAIEDSGTGTLLFVGSVSDPR